MVFNKEVTKFLIMIKGFLFLFTISLIFTIGITFNENIFLKKAYSETSEMIIPDDLNFSGLDFSEADLSYQDLENSKMYGTIFERANLSYANLKNAELAGAYLRNANLEDSH
jgi:uncharacterized protein YjbI with pentapeptide repeats